MVVVTFPPTVRYVWWKPQHGETRLTAGHEVAVPSNILIHMTAWGDAPDNTYRNNGSCLFIVVPNSLTDGHLSFGEPQTASDNSGAVELMRIRVKDAICLNKIFWNDLRPSFRGGHLSGFNRHAIIEWEWPFCMPGWHGISAIDVPIPGWQAALPWLEFHATGILGGTPFSKLDFNSQKSAIGIAIGAIGYLTG